MKINRPVMRYHGGKFLLADWIISNFPEHRVYAECFGGGGSVLMKKQRSDVEVYNDRWDVAVNVFKVLRDPAAAAELYRLVSLTPFARSEFDTCVDSELGEIADPIEKARRTLLRSFAGFGSASTNALHVTGFRACSSRRGTQPVNDWVNYAEHIKAFTERLTNVIIENRDYKLILKYHDSKQTFFYLDPPYVPETRNLKRGNSMYAHDFTENDHIEMAEQVKLVTGKVMISGYNCPLYEELFAGWRRVEKETYADGARKRIECLWMNYPEKKSVKQKYLYGN